MRFPLLAKLYELDKRSLAAFRIGLGAMLLLDLAIRFPDIGAHLTDDGLLSRELMLQKFPQSAALCLHLLTGSWGGQAFLFLIHAGCAGFFLVGKYTRLSAAACWLLLISLQSRNDMVLHGGDHYLRILFLWAIFLPLGSAWALDRTASAKTKTVASLATFCLVCQMAAVYWFAAALKTGPEWLSEHSALYYALNISYFTLPIGEWLLGYPAVLKVLTQLSLALEWVGPCFFFAPIRFATARLAVFWSFVLFHLGIGATLYLGTLPYVFLVPLLVLLPSAFWNNVEPALKRYLKNTRRFAMAQWLKTEPVFHPAWTFTRRLAPAVLLTTLGLYQLAENAETFTKSQIVPPSARWIATTFRIDQDWGMFAPYPYKHHGWYVIEGTSPDGELLPVLDREPATSDATLRPSVPALHRNGHWLSYSILAYTDHPDQLENYAAYFCRKWNGAARTPALAEVKLSFMRLITPPTPDVVHPKKEVLLTRKCDFRRGGGISVSR